MKLCKDCKFFSSSSYSCLHTARGQSLVTGVKDYPFADTARERGGHCTVEAIHFQPKPRFLYRRLL